MFIIFFIIINFNFNDVDFNYNDEVLLIPEIKEWQERPLDSVYPIVFIDAVHFIVRTKEKESLANSVKDITEKFADVKNGVRRILKHKRRRRRGW